MKVIWWFCKNELIIGFYKEFWLFLSTLPPFRIVLQCDLYFLIVHSNEKFGILPEKKWLSRNHEHSLQITWLNRQFAIKYFIKFIKDNFDDYKIVHFYESENDLQTFHIFIYKYIFIDFTGRYRSTFQKYFYKQNIIYR